MFYVVRLQQLEDRAHCAEANLARAVEDIHQLRYKNFEIHVLCNLENLNLSNYAG